MSDYHKEELERMHRELTDDEEIAQNKRRAEREKRKQEKREDAGL